MNDPISMNDMISFLNDYNVKTVTLEDTTLDIIKIFLNEYKTHGPFYIIDLSVVVNQYERWVRNLPNIVPYYAVKCNPDEAIIRLLDRLGAKFDCASQNEITQVLNLDISEKNIIFANPIKESSQIQFARSMDVDLLVLDNDTELLKIKLYHPNAKLLIRIKVDESKSLCKFNCKFGVDMNELDNLLRLCRASDLDIIGISFHVGSNCQDPTIYYDAIKSVSDAFDIGNKYEYNFSMIDIGGGFPGDINSNKFENIAEQINKGLDDFFPDKDDLNIISEPGRYFVDSSHTLVLNIIGKKKYKIGDETQFTYYLNDGVYGSFNCIYFDHAVPKIQAYSERKEIQFKSTIFGPTCDSIDIISDNCQLPDLAIGEHVYIENFGAYTRAAATTFNGFQRTPSYYVIKTTD